MNHGAQSEIAVGAAAALVGEANVSLDAEPRMFSEGFSYMLQARPGAFVFIGGGMQPDGEAPFLHNPDYDFNDRS